MLFDMKFAQVQHVSVKAISVKSANMVNIKKRFLTYEK